jgi:hypothetical protein
MRTITNCPPKVKAAMERVTVAYVKWQAAEIIDKSSKNRVLEKNIFADEESGERITDERHDFMMSDSDFEKYCQLVYEENLKRGLDSGGVGNTFWHLRKAVLDAENELIDTVAADIPAYTPEVVKTLKTNHKFREKFLKITFGESYQA